jgi:hypothetical protein
MGFETLNTFSYRRLRLPSHRWSTIHSKPIPPLRSPVKPIHAEIHVPCRVMDRIKDILDDDTNKLFKLQVFLDYVYNSIRSEILPMHALILQDEFTRLLNEKSYQYYCSWDNMIQLILEHTSLRFLSRPLANDQILNMPQTPVNNHRHVGLETPSSLKTPSYYSQCMSNIMSSLSKEEQQMVASTSAMRIDVNVADRVDSAIKSKGFALKESQPWEDDTQKNVIHTLVSSRKIPLTENENVEVNKLLNGQGASDEVVIRRPGYDFTRAKLRCLKPSTWLNDEIINYYMELLLARDNELIAAGFPRRKSHIFSSFFMQKLLDDDKRYNYANIKRWSKKFDIFSLDKAIFPINVGHTHWTLGVCFMQKKEIHYYDSMSGGGKRYLDAMLRWIVDEGREKKGIEVNPDEYKLIAQHNLTPQQRNGVDCGVFSTICADFLMDNLPIAESSYSQNDMPFFRRKILADIIRGKLLYPMICNPSNPAP